jgi:hypothetical protein
MAQRFPLAASGRKAMRLLMLGGILIAAMIAGPHLGAAEVVYPLCATYTRGSHNCGFVSFQQCQAAVQGDGGSCAINPRYDAPLAPGDRKVRRAD